MRTSTLLLLASFVGALFIVPTVSSSARAQAFVPGPPAGEPARQADEIPKVKAAGELAPGATVAEKRNWLLAALVVEQNFDGQQIEATRARLADMSDDQLDVFLRVYQRRAKQREAAEKTDLDEARANLDHLKMQRDLLSFNLNYLQSYRQAQYLNFGLWPRYGLGYGGMGYGGMGYGRMGYGGMGYGAGPVATPIPGFAYPAYSYPGAMGMGYGAGGYYGGYYPGFGAGY